MRGHTNDQLFVPSDLTLICRVQSPGEGQENSFCLMTRPGEKLREVG